MLRSTTCETGTGRLRFSILAGFIIPHHHILSFLLPLFQEGQLSVTGESKCTKYWLTA